MAQSKKLQSKAKKTQPKAKKAQFKPNIKQSSYSRALPTLIFVVMVFALGLIIHHFSSSSSAQPSNYLTTSTASRVYTSTQFGFSVNFPGAPTATDTSLQIQGINVPVTNYERDNNNGNADYIVTVDSYPSSFDMSDTKARLEGALNGEVENVKGSTLVSSNFTTIAGYTAITGHAKVTEDGQSYDMYSTSFLKSNTMFSMLTVGVSASDFNNFANSFKFSN
jgi:hypothetical protein